ncbi:MAG: Aspartate ammonia-lyase [Syntrophorhabdus sp. PtaU1.Bin058]|nr:MAG: Aspartate ammonia-lyase [Syntrophorhabdus sp. PtaU1.Bin058]
MNVREGSADRADMRIEKDAIGEVSIPRDALYGIQSVRARENFGAGPSFYPEWYRAMGAVKLACYRTYEKYKAALLGKRAAHFTAFPLIEDTVLRALITAAEEVMAGGHYNAFIVPALCGGAGTSLNMNINEIIANVALITLGRRPDDYGIIDPIQHANVFQSTNDVVPTSLRVAVMGLLDTLENTINVLRASMESLEKEHQTTIRIAYTQMQEAVPSSFGRLFGAYNEALSRDWWRVSKCFERIKVVNLGGSAIGTGITVPRFFIFEAPGVLREITGQPITRSENLVDATSNLDPLVEAHAILKAHAVNLEKISSDMRLLASDVAVNSGFSIPARQLGSTIMPGKVNPVIPEFVIGCCHRVYANDSMIASLSAQGCLELNAYLPLIGHGLIESLKCLIQCNRTLHENLVSSIVVDATAARERLLRSPAIVTALIPYIGYHRASELATRMKQDGLAIGEANKQMNVTGQELLDYLLMPQNLLRLGFVPTQVMDEIDHAGEKATSPEGGTHE